MTPSRTKVRATILPQFAGRIAWSRAPKTALFIHVVSLDDDFGSQFFAVNR
jgi:hypothetical protein